VLLRASQVFTDPRGFSAHAQHHGCTDEDVYKYRAAPGEGAGWRDRLAPLGAAAADGSSSDAASDSDSASSSEDGDVATLHDYEAEELAYMFSRLPPVDSAEQADYNSTEVDFLDIAMVRAQ
jgi:hypothetical protein